MNKTDEDSNTEWKDDSEQDDSVIKDGDKIQDDKTMMISKMDKMKRDNGGNVYQNVMVKLRVRTELKD